MGELSRIVDARNLLEVSALEQELANRHDHSAHIKALKEIIGNPNVEKMDLIRLVILYALRYETNTSNEVANLLDLLQDVGCSQEQISLISIYQ